MFPLQSGIRQTCGHTTCHAIVMAAFNHSDPRTHTQTQKPSLVALSPLFLSNTHIHTLRGPNQRHQRSPFLQMVEIKTQQDERKHPRSVTDRKLKPPTQTNIHHKQSIWI